MDRMEYLPQSFLGGTNVIEILIVSGILTAIIGLMRLSFYLTKKDWLKLKANNIFTLTYVALFHKFLLESTLLFSIMDIESITFYIILCGLSIVLWIGLLLSKSYYILMFRVSIFIISIFFLSEFNIVLPFTLMIL